MLNEVNLSFNGCIIVAYVKRARSEWDFKFSSIVRQLEVGHDVRRARQNVTDYVSRKLHLPHNDTFSCALFSGLSL